VYSFATVAGQARPSDSDAKKSLRKETTNGSGQADQGFAESGFFLKIYGLPVKFDETDLKSMFNNVNFLKMTTATPTPITSTNVNNGQSETVTSLKAKKICEVASQLDLERALTRQDEQVGKSKLKIYQINKQEYDRELAHAAKYAARNEPAPAKASSVLDETWTNDDVFAYVTNIPAGAREADLKELFDDINIIGKFACLLSQPLVFVLISSCYLLGIIPINDSYTQKPSGEAACYFATKQDCESALERDSRPFRGRPVQVQAITFAKYLQYAQKHIETIKSKSDNGPKRRVLLGDAPALLTRNVISPNSNGSSQNSSENDYNTYSSRNYNSVNNNGKRTDEARSPQALPPLPEEFQRYRNRLILLSNIAYDASREDILGLVANFSPIEHTLKIRHDDQGRPAGDAVVAFQNPEDANQAVGELDGYKFMGDHVRATLFSNS